MQKTMCQNQSRSSTSRTAPMDQHSNMNLVLEQEKEKLSLRKKKLEERIATHRGYQTLNLAHSQALEILRQKEEEHKLDDQLSIVENENSELAMTNEMQTELNNNRNIEEEAVGMNNYSIPKPENMKKEILESKENIPTAVKCRSFEWSDTLILGVALFWLISCFKEFFNLKGQDHPLLLNLGEINALIAFLLAKYCTK